MRGSRTFCQGGGGGSLTPGQRFFFVLFSFSPQLILQFTEGVKGSRGSTFLGGGGGSSVQVFISIEIHITCDFPEGGVRTPITSSGSAHGLIAG